MIDHKHTYNLARKLVSETIFLKFFKLEEDPFL